MPIILNNDNADYEIQSTDLIINHAGEKIILNEAEQLRCKHHEKVIKNNTGFDVDITTLTAISRTVVEQRFYKVAPADFMPVRVGENEWSQDILTWRSFDLAGDFESGIIDIANANARLSQADTAIDSVTVPVMNWGREVAWTVMELSLASQTRNWDLVTAKESSRKRSWDLGLQKTAFLGLKGNTNVTGLLTLDGVTENTSLIQKYIKDMSTTEFSALLADIMAAYQANANYTTQPNKFVIPQDDYTGLAAAADETYPLKTKLERLQEVFAAMTGNPDFKVLPLVYANQAQNADFTGLNKNRYTLYNDDLETLRMDIPVDYATTPANSLNGINFVNGCYAQFTGCHVYRPQEVIYFDWS